MAILIPILILIFAIVDSSSAQVAQLRLLLGLLGLSWRKRGELRVCQGQVVWHVDIIERENPGARRSHRNVPRRLPHGQVPLLLMLSLKPG